jgi:hypothetical protein
MADWQTGRPLRNVRRAGALIKMIALQVGFTPPIPSPEIRGGIVLLGNLLPSKPILSRPCSRGAGIATQTLSSFRQAA